MRKVTKYSPESLKGKRMMGHPKVRLVGVAKDKAFLRLRCSRRAWWSADRSTDGSGSHSVIRNVHKLNWSTEVTTAGDVVVVVVQDSHLRPGKGHIKRLPEKCVCCSAL